ncbi:MAG TPA: hypothetical protein VG965_04605 [Patescibacteria group bacterium]|nr:hypothetical protein [Patescibacteria group bacterium]
MFTLKPKHGARTMEDLVTAIMDQLWEIHFNRISESRMRVLANLMIDKILDDHAKNQLKTVTKKDIIKTTG